MSDGQGVPQHLDCAIAIVGGGPAGLMAADVLTAAGHAVHLFDSRASVGRKFLLAGKGGLNLTKDEPFDAFVDRYGAARGALEPALSTFGPSQMRDWAHDLGSPTFVGSSGRVFPRDMKAAPLLRGWLHRLRAAGLVVHARHRWSGWMPAGDDASPALRFDTPNGTLDVTARATVLALGGASWPQLGSDGAWTGILGAAGVDIAPLKPANCGFDVGVGAGHAARSGAAGWSDRLRLAHAGAPLKNVALALLDATGVPGPFVAGECVVTATGVEGGLVYALSSACREAIAERGAAHLRLDLLPTRRPAWVAAEVARPRGTRSLTTHLKSRLGIDGVKAALLYELLPRTALESPPALAAAIKQLPLTFVATRPIAEAISSAGGVRFDALDTTLMLRARPGVWCAGEMLDWEAPTGGYLLTACCATGVRVGHAVDAALARLAAGHRVCP